MDIKAHELSAQIIHDPRASKINTKNRAIQEKKIIETFIHYY